MTPAIKSELRKLVTVRSTYVILGFCLGLELLFAFYNDGLKVTTASLHNPDYMAGEVTQAISVLMLVVAMIGVLLVTHEYRYNTITYTLTASNRRIKVLLAKLITISLFVVAASIILGFLSPLLVDLGLHVKGHNLVHQVFPVWNLLWRVAFAGWAFAMLALIMAFIIRTQFGAVVAVFLLPGTVEPLIGLMLKKHQDYLPFSSINSIVDRTNTSISLGRAAMVASLYVILGWIIAWILFQRRDAN
jgi:ABC-type transport system involved in multi-copper enzyme maturation permease subunit